MGTIESGNLEQGYMKVEDPYATLATPESTDAIRHFGLGIELNLNREASPAKYGTPGVRQMLPRRRSVNWTLRPTHWEPSSTLGTPGYFGAALKAALGASHAAALATTFVADPAASSTGGTLTSATGLAVSDVGVATMASAARREITRVKTLATAAITFDALSGTPDTPGAFVSGVTYKLTSQITESLSIFLFHTGGGKKQAAKGALVNQVEIVFDGNGEVMISMSGPAADRLFTGFDQPGAHTTVGEPVSGLVGNLYLDGTALLVQKATIRLTNGLELRNSELGTAIATGYMRGASKREVSVEVVYYFDHTDLISTSEAFGSDVLRLLAGNVNGKMVGAVMPKIEWAATSVPDADGPKVLTQTGRGLETSGNDELFLAEI